MTSARLIARRPPRTRSGSAAGPAPSAGGASPSSSSASALAASFCGSGLRLNIPSIRSVTRKPPITLIVPKAIAITSSVFSSTPLASPITISPPSSTMPWIAFVPLISGVCSVLGTLEMTSKPTKAASTRMASSVSRSMDGS